MFGLLGIISTLFVGKKMIDEALEEPAPKGTRFDWDAYWDDVNNGVSAMERVRKSQRGAYNTTKPEVKKPEWWELPEDTVVDVERYEHDKKVLGEEEAEKIRQSGLYRQVKKFKD